MKIKVTYDKGENWKFVWLDMGKNVKGMAVF